MCLLAFRHVTEKRNVGYLVVSNVRCGRGSCVVETTLCDDNVCGEVMFVSDVVGGLFGIFLIGRENGQCLLLSQAFLVVVVILLGAFFLVIIFIFFPVGFIVCGCCLVVFTVVGYLYLGEG